MPTGARQGLSEGPRRKPQPHAGARKGRSTLVRSAASEGPLSGAEVPSPSPTGWTQQAGPVGQHQNLGGLMQDEHGDRQPLPKSKMMLDSSGPGAKKRVERSVRPSGEHFHRYGGNGRNQQGFQVRAGQVG